MLLGYFTRAAHFFAAACGSNPSLFRFPNWYSYLQMQQDPTTKACNVINFKVPGDFLLVGLAILDIALHIAGLVAVGYVIYGGIQYVISQGEPEKTARAQSTIINAIAGLAITFIAVALVSFLGRKLG